jgi:hypothetical protein
VSSSDAAKCRPSAGRTQADLFRSQIHRLPKEKQAFARRSLDAVEKRLSQEADRQRVATPRDFQ